MRARHANNVVPFSLNAMAYSFAENFLSRRYQLIPERFVRHDVHEEVTTVI